MKRNIPRKNYLIVVLMAIVVAALVLYLAKLYTNSNIDQKHSLMSNYLSNVTIQELDNYLLENPNIIIYWADNEDLSNNRLENDLKKYLIEHDLQRNIIFINTHDLTVDEINNVADKYLNSELKNKNIKLETIPNLLWVEDGKIVDVLYTYEQSMDMDNIKEYLENTGVNE
ncbi:MAG: DUF6568 family protein [Bacilli bacterium]